MRIYVAGPYSANNIITALENIQRGLRVSTELMLKGYAPFSPWTDFLFTLVARGDAGETITVEDYYRYSVAWLRVSEAVLVLPGWESSLGTVAEIKEAERLGIPVFYDISNLDRFRKEMEYF